VHPEALVDFAWRAIHLAALAGKGLVTAHYQRPAERAYYLGCSTGGRQGLVEAQRFPGDYDGIVAGAPVYTFVTQTSALLRNQAFAAAGAAIDDQKLAWVNSRMLAACDADDGLADGVLTDPRRCKLDPAELRCTSVAPGATDCLSAPQVAALGRVYRATRNAQGQVAAYALMRGSEAGWSRFITTTPATPGAPDTLGNTAGGLATLRAVLLGDAFFDLARFDPDLDLARIHGSAFARMYEADDPDLSGFLRRKGKLLLWHGIDDPGPSPWATVDYYEAARRSSKNARFADAVRLYLAPGVQHCGGGPGADDFDLISALDTWVSSGALPADIIATNRTRNFTRPLCAYPALPHYRSGDPASAASFSCEPPR
jgi:feruloyl esterase